MPRPHVPDAPDQPEDNTAPPKRVGGMAVTAGVSYFHNNENKTGTKWCGDTCKRLAPVLGIDRVWREVIDFGEPSSGTGEEGWGRKRVSVPRVSILDGPARKE